MKICLGCKAKYNTADWNCPICGFIPDILENYMCFSPELALFNDGFREESFEDLFELEGQNFWFTSRNKLIIWALKKYFPHASSFLEIGCGTGFVLTGIKKFYPNLALSGSEIYVKGLEYASQRLHNVNLFQMDARTIPFDSEFDVIGAFDVIEHIKEDEIVLSEIHKASNKEGGW